MKNIIERITDKCQNASGNIYDIYYALYKDFLAKSDTPVSVLQHLLTEVQRYDFEDDQNCKYITLTDIEETKELYFPLLKAYIHSLMLNNLTEEEFYQKLYNTVFQSEIFPQDEKKQAILLCFLSEKIPGIPYFQAMNLLKMTSDEYKEAIQHLKPQIEKAIDILNRSFKSRTEEASQIYEIMSSLKTRSDKIVFLAVYTNIIQNNTKQQLKRT